MGNLVLLYNTVMVLGLITVITIIRRRIKHSTSSDHHGSLQTLVRRFPLTAFFVIAYAVTWASWAPFVLSHDGLQLLNFSYPKVLGDTQLLGILPGGYEGPLFAAFCVTALTEGRDGLRHWRQRMTRWRVQKRWWLFAILGVPAIVMIATCAVPGALSKLATPPAMLAVIYLPLLIGQMLTTGISEEPGWRDHALPHMQRRFGPLGGTLLLGVLWACWHGPLFLTSWSHHQLNLPLVATYLGVAIALSIVITWVFNGSRESLPLAMLVHAGSNNISSTLWVATFTGLDAFRDNLTGSLIGFGTVALILIITTKGRLAYPRPVSAFGQPLALPVEAEGFEAQTRSARLREQYHLFVTSLLWNVRLKTSHRSTIAVKSVHS